MSRALCWIGCALLVLLLGASAFNGLYEGVIAIRSADTRGMQIATVTQLSYGLFARPVWPPWSTPAPPCSPASAPGC
jgi:hypothetical protein